MNKSYPFDFLFFGKESRLIRTIGVFILLISTNYLYGQKSTTDQSLVWYGVFTRIDISEKWYFQNEFQERHFVNPTVQHQFIIRSHMHRLLGKSGWETSLGMCLFLQNPNDPNVTIKLTVPELRPHIEFAYKQKLQKVIFDHRYRVEARFFHNTNPIRTELEDGFDFGTFRIRYRLQATIPFLKVTETNVLKFKISDEIHLNAGSRNSNQVFDQNRIYVGLNYDLLPNLSVEVGYLNWFQQRSIDAFYKRDILRFTVFHQIGQAKK